MRATMPIGPRQYNNLEVYCGLSTASEVFHIFTTRLYQYLNIFPICTI